jgi:hypothetical protein
VPGLPPKFLLHNCRRSYGQELFVGEMMLSVYTCTLPHQLTEGLLVTIKAPCMLAAGQVLGRAFRYALLDMCGACKCRGHISTTRYSHGQQTQSPLDIHLATRVMQKAAPSQSSTHPPSEGHAHHSEPSDLSPMFVSNTKQLCQSCVAHVSESSSQSTRVSITCHTQQCHICQVSLGTHLSRELKYKDTPFLIQRHTAMSSSFLSNPGCMAQRLQTVSTRPPTLFSYTPQSPTILSTCCHR